MNQYQQQMQGLFFKKVLENGTAVVKSMVGALIPSTVWAIPRNGDTVTISISFDGGETYEEWSKGAVTESSSDTLTSGVTHIKGQRTAGTGVASTFGVC